MDIQEAFHPQMVWLWHLLAIVNWTMLTTKPWPLITNTQSLCPLEAPGIQRRCRTNAYLMLSLRPVRQCHLHKAKRKASMRHYQLGLSLLRSEMTALSMYLCHSALHIQTLSWDPFNFNSKCNSFSITDYSLTLKENYMKETYWCLSYKLCNIIAFLISDCVFSH